MNKIKETEVPTKSLNRRLALHNLNLSPAVFVPLIRGQRLKPIDFLDFSAQLINLSRFAL
jgi:hypothetical protein